MKAIRATPYPLCLAAVLSGGVALASTATEPATTPQDTGSMRHELDGDHGHPGGPDRAVRRVLSQLDLTTEQKVQVRAIFDQAKPQLQATHQSGRAIRDQLEVTPPTDPGYAGMLASAKSNAADQIQLMSDLWTQVYAKLTPDQRARIPGLVAAERADRDARRAHWRSKDAK
jgi:Spy/CpxP family protein refolding chaperone